MLVRTETVRQSPSTPAVVRVHCAVGTAVVHWQGPPDGPGVEHHVEWTVDEDITWAANTRPAASPTPRLSQDAGRVVFRGRLSLTEDSVAVLDMGGALILFDLAGPRPPDGADGSWIEVHVGRDRVSVWPYLP
ncbi:hypothetical protein [Streptomyces sp. NPDC002746]